MDRGRYLLPSAPIIHHSLTHIATKSNPWTNFLSHVTLSSLTDFDYTHKSFQDTLDILVNFLDRSRPPLHHFSFYYWMNSSNRIQTWCNRLPKITDAKLNINRMEQCAASDEFLKQLAHDRDGSVVLPKVRTLEMDADMMMPSHWAAFGKILPTKSKLEDPPLEKPLDTQKTIPPPTFRIQRPWVMTRVTIRKRLADSNIMDKDTLVRFLSVREFCVEIDLRDDFDIDLLQVAGEYHWERFEVSDFEMLVLRSLMGIFGWAFPGLYQTSRYDF